MVRDILLIMIIIRVLVSAIKKFNFIKPMNFQRPAVGEKRSNDCLRINKKFNENSSRDEADTDTSSIPRHLSEYVEQSGRTRRKKMRSTKTNVFRTPIEWT